MKNELILFETADKEIKLNVSVKDSTVWLNRNQLAELFERDVKTIGKHINNALKEELDNSVVAKFATTALDGKIYQVEHYNLDMIISVGYRVKSNRGVEFRKWANKVLKQYIIQGYAINEKRLEALQRAQAAWSCPTTLTGPSTPSICPPRPRPMYCNFCTMR